MAYSNVIDDIYERIKCLIKLTPGLRESLGPPQEALPLLDWGSEDQLVKNSVIGFHDVCKPRILPPDEAIKILLYSLSMSTCIVIWKGDMLPPLRMIQRTEEQLNKLDNLIQPGLLEQKKGITSLLTLFSHIKIFRVSVAKLESLKDVDSPRDVETLPDLLWQSLRESWELRECLGGLQSQLSDLVQVLVSFERYLLPTSVQLGKLFHVPMATAFNNLDSAYKSASQELQKLIQFSHMDPVFINMAQNTVLLAGGISEQKQVEWNKKKADSDEAQHRSSVSAFGESLVCLTDQVSCLVSCIDYFKSQSHSMALFHQIDQQKGAIQNLVTFYKSAKRNIKELAPKEDLQPEFIKKLQHDFLVAAGTKLEDEPDELAAGVAGIDLGNDKEAQHTLSTDKTQNDEWEKI